jgi:diguanylate cyclase (GGDEF)-like protein
MSHPLTTTIRRNVALMFTLGCLLFAISTSANANNIPKHEKIIVSEHDQIFQVNQVLYVYEDESTELGVNDLVDMPSQNWTRVKQSMPSYGFSTLPLWFSITVKNTLPTQQKFYLEIDYAALDNIEFYSVTEDGRRSSYIAGDRYPYYERPVHYPSFLFPFTIDANASSRLLFKVENEGPMVVPTRIWFQHILRQTKQSNLLAYGAFVGAMLVMALYNFGLFAALREKSYLFYSLFSLCYVALSLSIEGVAYQVFWQDYPILQRRSILTFGALTSLFLILFTRYFLPISEGSRIRTVLQIFTIVALLNLIGTFVLPYTASAILQASVMLLVVIASVSISALLSKRSQKLARLFLISWLLFFISIATNLLTSIGLAPYSSFNEYGSMVGAVVGLVLLSLVLGNRINTEKRHKDLAKQEAVHNLHRFKALYENSLEGIFLLDQDWLVVDANPRFRQLIPGDPIGQMLPLTALLSSSSKAKEIRNRVYDEHEVRNIEAQFKANGDEPETWLALSLKQTADTKTGTILYEGSVVDINAVKAFERRLSNLALQDPLTGLLNRRTLESQMKEQLGKTRNAVLSGVVLLDVDQFSVINKLYGHAVGDSLLRSVADLFQSCISQHSKKNWSARIAGDEFCSFIQSLNSEQLEALAEELRKRVGEFMLKHEDKDIHIEGSVGLVIIEGQKTDINSLIATAQYACKQAKKQGRNRVHVVYDREDSLKKSREQATWIERIRFAVNNKKFALQIQEIRPTRQQSKNKNPLPAHFEVLLRMALDDNDRVSPSEFLPAAERYGLMPLIDRYVFETFFDWMNAHPEEAEKFDCASINVSMQSIADSSFREWLVKQFKEKKVNGKQICLEFTESVAMSSLEETHAFINTFKDLGCRFALDDFGTGFSSYAQLKDLGVDYVKIDGVFVHNIVNNPVDHTLVKSIADVAQAMQIETIAEYVENQAIVDTLEEIGIDHIQGYFIHKPEPL